MPGVLRAIVASTGVALSVAVGASPASANHNGPGCVVGAIAAEYAALGGPQGFLGNELTCELGTPTKPGRFNHFEGGSIYWSPTTPAREVHGGIRDRWAAMGWENSRLGFPVTNELATPFHPGRFNHFQDGSIYWSAQTGAHEIYGAIREKWFQQGGERGPLGFPVSGESGIGNGIRRSLFQGGYIDWFPSEGAGIRVTNAVGCAYQPTSPVNYELAAACLHEAWKRGDRRLAGTYATSVGVAGLFNDRFDGSPTPYTGAYDLTDGPDCRSYLGQVSCWWYIPAPGETHGVGVEMFMAGPAHDAFVTEVAFYG